MSIFTPKRLLLILLLGILGWFSIKFLLPILLPFVLAALLALAAEPLVDTLSRRARLPRAAATGIGVTVAIGILALAVMVLGALLVRQLRSLGDVVPDLEGTTRKGMQLLQVWMMELTQKAPEGIRPMLSGSVENFFSDGTVLLDKATGWLLGLASGVVSHLPDSALGIGTWLVASFMFSAKLPKIRAFVAAHVPDGWTENWLPALRRMKQSAFGWLTAQLKLMAVTFLVLTAGFFLLQVSHGTWWAFLISLVDALPVLGTGTVLVPWSIVSFLQGDSIRAVGLLGIYAAVMLLRSILEPRLVGKQLGLDSLVTLMAIYAGYRIWGILGMILAPLITVTVVQLFSIPRKT